MVSTEEFFALHRGITQAGNDPGFGLRLGTEERLERYDPVKIAAISARSFRDAIARITRYKQLTCPEATASSSEGMNPLSSSSGFWRMTRNRRCWWTSVLRGSS